MIIISKNGLLLQLPEKKYGTIKRVGILNNEPILYGDINQVKPGSLFYLAGMKQVYRYIKAKKRASAVGGGKPKPNLSLNVIEYYFDTIKPTTTDGLLISEEERGHIRNAGYLFNEIIYSGDPNLVENGSLFYHDTLPYISIVSNVDGTINLSTKELDEEGEITTVVTEYTVNAKHDYSKDYLTFEALEDGTISFNIWKSMGTDMVTSISYSTNNGQTWTTTNNTDNKSEHLVINVNVNQGDKILWKGIATQTGYNDTEDYGYYVGSFFSSNCEFNVYGNIMSLLYGDDFYNNKNLGNTGGTFALLFSDYDEEKTCEVVSVQNLILPATTLASFCYHSMFNGCTSLTTAPELPATTLAESCYNNMFNGCTALTTAPALPATTLAGMCYGNMFNNCTSLTIAPKLPATTLVAGCYSRMFYGCTSLTTAELPATTLVQNCYAQMFNGCTQLNYIKAMFTTTPSTSYTRNWVQDVAATGTFVKNANATWTTTGVNGVPTGWAVERVAPALEPGGELDDTIIINDPGSDTSA